MDGVHDIAYAKARAQLAAQEDREDEKDYSVTSGVLTVRVFCVHILANCQFQVTIRGCRGLLNKEKIGKVNPYLRLHLGLLPEQLSPIIKNTLEPQWNQTFTFEVIFFQIFLTFLNSRHQRHIVTEKLPSSSTYLGRGK